MTTEFSLLGLLDAPVAETTEHTTALEYVPQNVTYAPPAETTFPAVGNAAVDHIGTQQTIPEKVPGAAASSYINPLRVAAILWLTGIGAMTAYSVISLAMVRRRLIGAVHLRENIYLADYVESPFVMGWLCPKIYLPSALSEQEQGYIILHEQHHIRRGDHIIKALSFLALCIHWFNPLVWLAFILSGKDMEMSCDEAVVRKLGEGIRRDYSASLLSLATGRRIIAGTPLAFGEGDTKSRIRNMLRWKKPSIWITAMAAVLCAAVAMACAGNPAAAAEQEDAPPAGDAAVSGEQAGHTAKADAPASSVELLGEWRLDVAYTEAANGGISLRGLFGTALGDYGASLRIGSDGSIAYHIGLLTGSGTWRADGDTGRYIAELTVYPDERKESLTFHTFREDPESTGYIVLERDDCTLYWTQISTETPSSAAPALLEDAAYHLELAAGEAFRGMTFADRISLLAEYEDLLDGYDLIARETEDGKSAYIVGQYRGDPAQSPLYGMYSMEYSIGQEEVIQLLYQEADSDAVEKALAEQKNPSAGYRITGSRIHWSSDSGLVLIQPKDTALSLDVAWNRYLFTPNGREYIADAVSRGIDVCNRTDTYLYVYRITEQFGELAERIALTEAEAAAILAEKKVSITEGFGFSATLHINGETTYYNEHSGIPQTVLDLAVERCDYRFGDPSYITDTIREAQLICDWLDEPLYAKTEDLPRLRKMLKNAEQGYVGACGYGATLKLTFTGGEKLTVFKGCDGCDTIVFGSYGGYFLGDQENTAFWEIFGLDPDTKLPIGYASPED